MPYLYNSTLERGTPLKAKKPMKRGGRLKRFSAESQSQADE